MAKVVDYSCLSTYDQQIVKDVRKIVKAEEIPKFITKKNMGLFLFVKSHVIFEYDEVNDKVLIGICDIADISAMIKMCKNSFPEHFTILFPVSIDNPDFGRKTIALLKAGFDLYEESVMREKDEFFMVYILANEVADREVCETRPIDSCLNSLSNRNYKDSLRKVEDVLESLVHMFEKGSCLKKILFTVDSVKYLKKLCEQPREYSGCLNLTTVNEQGVYIVEINKKSVTQGNDDSVDSLCCMYSYHTHPRIAYKKYNVKWAWPSVDDYRAFLELNVLYSAIFHIVASIEGAYIIYINPDVNLKQLSKREYNSLSKAVGKKYKDPSKISTNKHDDKHDPHTYIQYINGVSININSGLPQVSLYKVLYYPWIELSNKVIELEYSPISC